LTHEPPDAGSLRSDRRPGSPLDQSSQTRRSAPSTRSRVPLRRKRPAGTQGSGDIDKPSAVTERACSIGDHALSEIDAPGPHLTSACGGRLRRPRTEEWPLPDDHPRSRCQLGALDPRSPITEEGLEHRRVSGGFPRISDLGNDGASGDQVLSFRSRSVGDDPRAVHYAWRLWDWAKPLRRCRACAARTAHPRLLQASRPGAGNTDAGNPVASGGSTR
jgi:hypothetical protein